MMFASPVRFHPDVEVKEPNEAETVESLKQVFDTILETTAREYGHSVRSVHAKAHAILQGELSISDDLTPEVAQGMFARPGKHKLLMRISTNAGDILPDAISLPRGIALKVLGVEGERLPGAEGTTQDFVMVNGPVFQTRTAEQFLGNLKLLARTTDRLEGTKEALSSVLRGVNTALEAVGIESPKIQALGGAPNVDPLGETYHSVTPFRFGDYIAKFCLAPISPGLTALTGNKIDARGREDAIRETVRDEMRGNRGRWEFRVQLCRDLEKQPVEDPTVNVNGGAKPGRWAAQK
ncbi:catalase family protein [Amaricoccus sp. W119]|uniref:catalase family protein n=1 Tax=Amaricoccus sp. W119 TaxID=3391833 RepID=UPI0039A74481